MPEIFKIVFCLRDRYAFYVKMTENFDRFQYFNSETNFLKNENLLWKKLEYRFLVKSTRSENATVPYKIVLPEVNDKTYRMGSTKKSITKKGVFPVPTLFLWKFCFSQRTSFKVLIWCTVYPNVHIHTFRTRWSFICGCFFPVSIPNEKRLVVWKPWQSLLKYEYRTNQNIFIIMLISTKSHKKI